MENAASAVGKLFGGSSATTSEDTTKNASTTDSPSTSTDNVAEQTESVDSTVAPAVENTHVKKTHETRQQTAIEKEKHKDHYHTTVQPLKDNEVLPTKHDSVQETEYKETNKDDGAAEAQAAKDRSGFESTTEEKKFESATKEPTLENEHVHHHLHETVQPVIEKEVIDPSVTHKRVDVKEKIQEPSENHGVTTNSAIPVEEFEKKLNN
ncbi:hypothetical protein LSUE1_G005434 [Lachnellula suecica]|uniref:Allergen n=1 Tax=Lachnellula suecica TaxID=602035 RepID=A0A8T9C7G6_9HELO|nr:hypothetical protein LSUE1_G005434 [Lachnellula suecica]